MEPAANPSNQWVAGLLRGGPLLLVGLAGAIIGAYLDGFVGGLLIGAGIALIALGAYLLGASTRSHRGVDDEPRHGWLPSRDEHRS